MATLSATPVIPEIGTSNEMEVASFWLNDFRRFTAEWPEMVNEPDFVYTPRREAIERFAEIGFPTTRREQWRATNVAPIARTLFRRAPQASPDVDPAALASLTWDAAATLVFVDGRFAPALSRREELPAGVFAGSLAEAIRTMPK